MGMTVRDFTSRLWYAQKIMVIAWKEFDKCNDIDDIRRMAKYVGTPHELRNSIYKQINDYLIDSYGVMDNTMIIEVHA